jgi:hypothetical protein
MKLTGLPINLDRVQEVKLDLSAQEQDYLDTVHSSPCMKAVNALPLVLAEGTQQAIPMSCLEATTWIPLVWVRSGTRRNAHGLKE